MSGTGARAVAGNRLAEGVIRSDLSEDSVGPRDGCEPLAGKVIPKHGQGSDRNEQGRIAALGGDASSLFTVTNKLRGGASEMTSHGTAQAHQHRQSRTITDLLGQRSTFGEDGRELFVAAAHPPSKKENLLAGL